MSIAPTNPESVSVQCRTERPDDEAFLFEVYASTRNTELGLTGWNAETKAAFLRMQFQAMRQGYAAQYPKGDFLVVLRGDNRIGRMVIDRNSEEIRLIDIALLPEERGRGIGTRLVRELQKEASCAGRGLRLQAVKNSGPAQWYRRLGFVVVQDDGIYESMDWRREARQTPA
jgi:ribosomal protein S18 acetylase RimI-like enzyme